MQEMNKLLDELTILSWETCILVAIIVIIICTLAYIKGNNEFKNSAYGKQSKMSFWAVQSNKGARGEYRTSQVLEKAPFEYKMLFNCYIPNRKGDKTELDIILISTKGIYAVENKNYSGRIFGDESSKNWCEIMGGKKFFFYNPVKQNRSHINNLEKLLQIGPDKYISLITFNGNANLRKIKVESENVHVVPYKQLEGFIKGQTAAPERLTHDEIEEIYSKLLPGTQLTDQEKQEHIERINQEFKKKIQ